MEYTSFRQIHALRDRDPRHLLWYAEPASRWLEALPLGNGRMGAMVYGGTLRDRYQLNLDTLYSDEPGRRELDLDITRDFDRVTGLLASEKYAEADELITKRWLGRSWPCYQPAADLWIEYETAGSECESYWRSLDLGEGIHRASWRNGNTAQTHKTGTVEISKQEISGKEQDLDIISVESFTSAPDDILAVRIAGHELQMRICFSSVHPTAGVSADENDRLILDGQAPGFVLRRTLEWVEKRNEQWKYPELWNADGTRKPHARQVLYGDEIDGLGTYFRFELLVRTDGESKVVREDDEASLRITGAGVVEILLAGATSYNGYEKSPSREGADTASETRKTIDLVSGKSFDEIRRDHIRDHGGLFERVRLDLGETTDISAQPTDRRIAAFLVGTDPSFPVLYYQYARYMAIAGSRLGTQPLNLQGIWNDQVIPPWAGAYTVNINTQMNYWPVESGNLLECGEPLVRLVQELADNGRKTAREMYRLDGWVAHHNTTIWRCAQPVDNVAQTSFWPMGSGWLCRHLWDRYLFTCDDEYLRETAYPLMRGACEFYLAWLRENADGYLVTPVGTSPENYFVYPDSGAGESAEASVSSGPTMDMSIIRDLFHAVCSAARLLEVDDEFVLRIEAAEGRLLPFAIASDGQLKEWSHDYPGYDPQHRHLSHLYGAYPANLITRNDTPTLYDAVGRSLDVRGETAGGWSAAWKMNLRARRDEGASAYRNMRRLLSPELTNPNMMNGHRIWSDTDGLFQIDGNMGGAAGIIEMLIQSRYEPPGETHIRLLPALPSQWENGELTGVRCRGAVEVSMKWRDASLIEIELYSFKGIPVRLEYKEKSVSVPLERGSRIRLDGDLQRQVNGGES